LLVIVTQQCCYCDKTKTVTTQSLCEQQHINS